MRRRGRIAHAAASAVPWLNRQLCSPGDRHPDTSAVHLSRAPARSTSERRSSACLWHRPSL